MAKQSKSALAQAESKLGALSLDELQSLQDTIAKLIVVKQAESPLLTDILLRDDAGGTKPTNKKQANGYIESKTINNCGPYLYLRRWQGKTLTSKYLGKGNSEAQADVQPNYVQLEPV